MTDEELERLREGFDTRRLLAAVDDLDLLRSRLADHGRKPPELRDRLLRLHGLAMKVVDSGTREAAEELFNLAGDLDLEVFDLLEAVTRLQETLEALTDLRPPSLDDGD